MCRKDFGLPVEFCTTSYMILHEKADQGAYIGYISALGQTLNVERGFLEYTSTVN